jgi:hypothetical protein
VANSIRQAANAGIVAYLEHRTDPCALPDTRTPRPEQKDHWESGSHPDIVERVWDQLGAGLPTECRQVVLGSPALVDPVSGVIFALAIGTQYAVRLPLSARSCGQPPGVRTTTTWAGGQLMDIQATFGPEWVFGSWAPVEESWCRDALSEPED